MSCNLQTKINVSVMYARKTPTYDPETILVKALGVISISLLHFSLTTHICKEMYSLRDLFTLHSISAQVIKYMTIKLINISHEVQGSWFHTGSYSQLRCEWFKVVNFLLSSNNYAHTLSYLATVMRKVYAVRNNTYIRYAIQILVVCALRKRKNASATETMPRHNSPNKDQFIFT